MKRRTFLMSTAALAASPWAFPSASFANGNARGGLSWPDFIEGMERLAAEHHQQRKSARQVQAEGIDFLKRLDVGSATFRDAVDQSYESGNRFWLWQRMAKQPKMLGGILTIDAEPVPLHDHPGAVGMVRILSGAATVWQYDRVSPPDGKGLSVLKRTKKAVLKPGDIGVLGPHDGNIHALQATTTNCRMLDFFIPPYRRQNRSWYMPQNEAWHEQKEIVCRVVPESEFTTT